MEGHSLFTEILPLGPDEIPSQSLTSHIARNVVDGRHGVHPSYLSVIKSILEVSVG